MSTARFARDYPLELAQIARQMCLHVATVLGDLMPHVVVVGGLVPSLLVDQENEIARHLGTRDLDLGLTLEVLDDERYQSIGERLRCHGFQPSVNEKGNLRKQTWCLSGSPIQIDFLIASLPNGPAPGKLHHLEPEFAAYVAPALAAAELAPVSVEIEGQTLSGARARRTIKVCSAPAFVVLKAHAIRNRSFPKDAYDLVYMLKNYGDGLPASLALGFAPIMHLDVTQEALTILAEDFETLEHVGAQLAATFLTGEANPEEAAEAFGYVQALLDALEVP